MDYQCSIASRGFPFGAGFEVDGLRSALIAALVIGLVNATLGVFLKIVTLPLTLVSLGLFLLVINALMLMFASHFVRGFIVHGFVPAFWEPCCSRFWEW